MLIIIQLSLSHVVCICRPYVWTSDTLNFEFDNVAMTAVNLSISDQKRKVDNRDRGHCRPRITVSQVTFVLKFIILPLDGSRELVSKTGISYMYKIVKQLH